MSKLTDQLDEILTKTQLVIQQNKQKRLEDSVIQKLDEEENFHESHFPDLKSASVSSIDDFNLTDNDSLLINAEFSPNSTMRDALRGFSFSDFWLYEKDAVEINNFDDLKTPTNFSSYYDDVFENSQLHTEQTRNLSSNNVNEELVSRGTSPIKFPFNDEEFSSEDSEITVINQPTFKTEVRDTHSFGTQTPKIENHTFNVTASVMPDDKLFNRGVETVTSPATKAIKNIHQFSDSVERSASDVSDLKKKKRLRDRKDNRDRGSRFRGSDPFPGRSRSASRKLGDYCLINSTRSVPTSLTTKINSNNSRDHSLDNYHRSTSSSTVDRVDSGVGFEEVSRCSSFRKKNLPKTQLICEDCNSDLSFIQSHSFGIVCKKCQKLRFQRREVIRELFDTEIAYGKDLRIIKEAFYNPISTSDLLTVEQVGAIFLNLDELIQNNITFCDLLEDGLDCCENEGDDDYTTLCIGKMFKDSTFMFDGYERFCSKQFEALETLDQIEKEKELLRIFLQVSQSDNSLVRRMNLKSFLVKPAQRIMKYPLLLQRLSQSTPTSHPDFISLTDASSILEEKLEKINLITRQSGSFRVRRITSRSLKKFSSKELYKIAVDMAGWSNRENVELVLCTVLEYSPNGDEYWSRLSGNRLNNQSSTSFSPLSTSSTSLTALSPSKFQVVHCLLLTLGKTPIVKQILRHHKDENNLCFSDEETRNSLKSAALVIIKEKNNKYIAFKEPVFLDKCIVSSNDSSIHHHDITVDDNNQLSSEKDIHLYFHPIGKSNESFLLRLNRASSGTASKWRYIVRFLSINCGKWRRRRNGLANVIINKPS